MSPRRLLQLNCNPRTQALGLSHIVRGMRPPPQRPQQWPSGMLQQQPPQYIGQGVAYYPGAQVLGGPTPLHVQAAQAQRFYTPEELWQAQQLQQQQARAAVIQRQLLTREELYAQGSGAPPAASGSSASRGGGGISGGSRPPPAGDVFEGADGSVTATSGAGGEGWLGAMRRRIDTLSARFRRQQAVEGRSSGGGSNPASSSGSSSWFGRARGGTGYAPVSTAAGGEGISSGGAIGGGDDDDDGHLLGRGGDGSGAHVDRTQLLDGSGFNGAPTRVGGIEIELSEAGGGGRGPAAQSSGVRKPPPAAAAAAPSSSLYSHDLDSAYSSINVGEGQAAPSAAYAIDDDEDEEDVRLTPAGVRRQQHV